MYFQIQCGNFEWNKIHNLDVGSFVKNPKTGRFLFFLAHILAYRVSAYLLPEVRNTPNFFFSNGRVSMPSDTSFERLLIKEYNAPFVSLIFSKLTC
jgi:hypothetical protein